jgi:hypothetical protein
MNKIYVGQVIHCSGTVFVGYDAIREDFFRVGEVEDGYFRAYNLNGPLATGIRSIWMGRCVVIPAAGASMVVLGLAMRGRPLRVVSFDSHLLRAMELLSGVDVGLEGIPERGHKTWDK